MYHILEQAVKCGDCGSERCEYVQFLGVKFWRCRECGHEGNHEPQLPEMSSGIAYVHDPRQHIEF